MHRPVDWPCRTSHIENRANALPHAIAQALYAGCLLYTSISDDAHCRSELRRYYHAFGMVKSVKAKDEDSVYTQYYDYTEPCLLYTSRCV